MLRDGFLRFCDDPEIACCRAEAELGQLRTENAQLHAKLAELQELAKAKACGRLVVLPCKVGDTVYVVSGCLFYRDETPYTPCEVVVFKQGKQRGVMMHLRPLCEEAAGTRYHRWFPVTSIGKTAFLTREEAEKAIAEAKRAAEESFAEAFCDFAESNANREFERQMREGWEE